MLWQIALSVVAAWLIFDHFYRKYVHRSLNCITAPNVTCFPFIGQAHAFLGNDQDRMSTFMKLAEISTRLGGVTKLWFARRLFLITTDAVLAEELLKVFITKDDTMDIMQTLTGTGSIFAPVSLWRPRRKQIVPAFSPRNLKQFMPVFAEGSSTLVRRLQDDCEGTPQQLWNYLTMYTLDAACDDVQLPVPQFSVTTLGVNLEVQKNPNQPFLEAFDRVSKLLADRVCQPWLQTDWVYQLLPQYRSFSSSKQTVCNFITEIIKSRRILRKQECENTIQTDQNSNIKPRGFCSFLDILLDIAEETDGISDNDLRDECIVMSAAGTDTSAVAMGFTLSMLARHPEVQEKAFEECLRYFNNKFIYYAAWRGRPRRRIAIYAILGKCKIQKVFGESKRPITGKDLLELNYIDAVIRESLRLYPPAPVIVRKVDSNEKLSSLPTLVPGMGILISIWGIHRNPKYWGPDAEDFRPERFLDSSVRHPAAFLPFSNGPRNCIGYQYAMMSIKTAIANIMRHYRVSLPNDCPEHKQSLTRFPDCPSCKVPPMKLKFDIMMKDQHQFTLKLERRN